MIIKKEINGTYNLHTILTDKFKQCHLEVIFHNEFNKDEITIRNVLFEMIKESSKNYVTNRELKLKLEDLYGASLYSVTSKVGNAFISNLCLDFLNPEYSTKDLPKEAINLLFELIFNPFVINNEFDAKTLDKIKKRVKDEINKVKENPRKKAIIECLNTLGDTPTAYNALGSLEDLDKITPESLYKYYEHLLKNDLIEIYVVGNLDMQQIANYIYELSAFRTVKNHKYNVFTNEERRKLIVNSRADKYSQTNLVCLLNLTGLSTYEKNYVANLYSIILGGGALQSKLYRKLRVENSLCYNVSVNYLKYDNLMMISTGIDPKAKDQALKLIKECLKDMTKNITVEELMQAKEIINTSLNMTLDDAGKIVDNNFYLDLGLIDDIETRINTFKNITIEEIYNLSKKIDLVNIYALEGESNE